MIPLATTTVTILRPASGDPYETASASTVATGIGAHISAPSGAEIDRGGQLERIDAVLLVDAGTDLEHTDEVTDDATGDEYRVAWVRARRGLGLDHVKAGLVAFHGGANDG